MSSPNDDRTQSLNEIRSRIATAYSADDSEGRRIMFDELLRDGNFTEGPIIGVVELAQLVDVRVRSRFGKKKPSAKEVAAEIDATLNLIEMCQWILHIRQRQSSLREIRGIDTLNTTSIPMDSSVEDSILEPVINIGGTTRTT